MPFLVINLKSGNLSSGILGKPFTKGSISETLVNLCLTILSIGFTRIWLGVHYPSDILGGFSLGLFWLSLFVVLDKIDWTKAVKK